MKKQIAAFCVIGALTLAPSVALADDCPDNWGQLTSQSIAEGFDQGSHSSDPSGDGVGSEPRVGLANVVERGNLSATLQLLLTLLGYCT